MIKAVCWGVLILILLAVATLALYIVGMTLYFHYQLKDGRTRREYTEEQKKGRRRTDSGNQGNAGKERRKASEEAAKKE